MVENLDSSDVLELEETDHRTDVDAVLLNALDKQARKIELVPWVAHAPTNEILLERKKKAIERLGVSKRTFEYWIKAYRGPDRINALTRTHRADKGKHRVNTHEFDWEEFTKNEWTTRTKAGQIMSPADIHGLVQSQATVLGIEKCPSESTVRRILRPLIIEAELSEGTGSAGQGARSVVYTNDGKQLQAKFSNCLVQADDTLLDVLAIDDEDNLLGRPWLTLIVDVFSTCILGFLLSIERPGSAEIALAIRHAILPKQYPAEYGIQGTFPYGKFFAWHTDKGRNLHCDHIKAIGSRIGFECHVRAQPKEGGNVERPFGTLNTQVIPSSKAMLTRIQRNAPNMLRRVLV